MVLAVAEGRLTAAELVPVRDAVSGAAPLPADRPLVLESVGTSWRDLVVAEPSSRQGMWTTGAVVREAR